MKIQKSLFIFILTLVLSACNQQTIEDPADPWVNGEYNLSYKEIEDVIEEQGLELKEAVLSNGDFMSELNGVEPKSYRLEGNPLSVYLFPAGAERAEGVKSFEESRTGEELEKYRAYGIENVLVIYVDNANGINAKLSEALGKLNKQITTSIYN
ncbi:hypothetical protein [Cytobacillus dafuensis]|uniref:Uncharacterized protein n=1 Tax=Cytobacillus dafuensis TaxID=1742359 RepID=A0A5B8Z9R5_CYTDA|nr:hypothetical protein [Cytobacillus dafuensis]QED49577.1 hypothetical protein FSZ17_21205 [Cytobacillus dafuensis]